MPRSRELGAAVLALVLACPARAPATPPARLSVAAAANLKPALEEIERAFEVERPDVDVVATFAASGTLYAQIASGAPFDVFFSADRDYPRKAIEAGLAEGEVVYARGRLVVWVPRASKIDVVKDGLTALARPEVRRIAIANPALAPYGRAAEAALRGAGIWATVEPKLVRGQSVAQAAQYAQSGAADAAFLPLSLALVGDLAAEGRVAPIDEGAHPPIEQSAVVLAGARAPDLARALLAFVRGEKGRAILARSGYLVP